MVHKTKTNNPEKLATYGTQDEEKQNKNTTQYDRTPLCANKHKNVNKTRVHLQTTGDKDEPNIVFMRKSQRTSQHRTQNVKTHSKI